MPFTPSIREIFSAAAFTAPPKLLLALVRVMSSPAVSEEIPLTASAPAWVMSPAVAVAVSEDAVVVPRFRSFAAVAVSAPAVVVPRFRSSPATNAAAPVVLATPSNRSLASVSANDPAEEPLPA